MNKRVIQVTAPKAGIEKPDFVEITVNEFPETINEFVSHYGEKVVLDNLTSIAEQKCQNSARAMLNPKTDGSRKSPEEVQRAHANWKLGAVRVRGTKKSVSDRFMESMANADDATINAEIEKLKKHLAAKKSK